MPADTKAYAKADAKPEFKPLKFIIIECVACKGTGKRTKGFCQSCGGHGHTKHMIYK